MPLVPVVSFWSTRDSIPMAELSSAATAGNVRMTADDAAALGWSVPASAIVGTADDVRVAVREAGVMGVLRATDVEQSVRALGIDNTNLFGNDRVETTAEWPLVATVQSSETWDQSASWSLVAAGDVMLDRGVAQQTTILGKGANYLFDGGTARVTRVRCCSFYNYPYPDVERTGNGGAMRELLTGADLTMANLETAILENAPFHDSGFTFTSDASLLPAFVDAGFDMLSLANNHSRDAGERGLTTAIEHLDSLGIAHAGAGAGTDVFAPAILEANGTTVAIFACNGVRGPGAVEPSQDRVQSMSCNDGSVTRAIRDVRPNADVVIVFPHWGVEYYPKPRTYQREQAAQWMEAGADLVTGAHSHFPGGMEDIDGNLVMYSMGNFIFDQDFRQATMMGLVPEMTFNGSELKQVWLHTTLIVDAQPNLANPDTDGQFAYDLVRDGSRGLLDY